MPVTINGTTGIAGVDGSASTPAVQGTDTNTGIFFPAADTIAFGEGGTEAMRIDSSGRVGIGTTSPLGLLQLNSDAGTGEATNRGNLILVNQTGAGPATNTGIEFKGSVSGSGYGAKLYINNNSDYFGIATRFNSATWTERLVINENTGDVGIGTTSPQAKLDVQVVGTSAAATTLNLFNPNSSGSSAGNDLNFQMWNNASARTTYATLKSIVEGNTGGAENGSLRFLTIGSGSLTERARITSAGYLLVGTTSNASNGMVAISYARGTTAGMRIQDTVGSGGNGVIADFYNSSGTSVGSITHNSSNTTYGTSSDYRLKENVQPMTGALERVAALKPCTYRWKETGIDGEGFIAHELQAVVPDAVVGEKDAVNEDGSIKPQSIDTSFLVATLTAAIQELKAITEAQATRIETLEAQNAAFEARLAALEAK